MITSLVLLVTLLVSCWYRPGWHWPSWPPKHTAGSWSAGCWPPPPGPFVLGYFPAPFPALKSSVKSIEYEWQTGKPCTSMPILPAPDRVMGKSCHKRRWHFCLLHLYSLFPGVAELEVFHRINMVINPLAKPKGFGASGLFSLSLSNTEVRQTFLHRILNEECRENISFSDTFTATRHESVFPLNGRETQFYRLQEAVEHSAWTAATCSEPWMWKRPERRVLAAPILCTSREGVRPSVLPFCLTKLP